MEKLKFHTKINLISFVFMILLSIAFGDYIWSLPEPPSRGGEYWGSDLAGAMGQILLPFIFSGFLLLIWSLRVLWTIFKSGERNKWTILNMIVLMIAWLPVVYVLIVYAMKRYG